MKEVKLRMNEQEKYEVIKELVDHKGNKNRASKELDISRRQIDRLIIKYKEGGKSAFVHGNRGHVPSKTLDKSISEDIILLYNNKYQGWNFNHFNEFLKIEEIIDVSYNFIYKTLTKAGILSPKAKKEFKKKQLLNENKINNTMSDEQINHIVNHEIALEDSHPRGEKTKYFGEVIEQDGSIHMWFGGVKTCLHLAIDKATSTIVGAWFDYQETLNGYYHVLDGLISPLEGINPEDIGLEKLLNRLKNNNFKEIIFAFNPSIESETTAMYIKRILEGTDIKITRLASGVPMGANMEYIDKLTLERAMMDRKVIE